MSKWSIAGIALLLTAGLVLAAAPEPLPDDSGVMTITARHARTPPAGMEDPVWLGISPVQVPVAGRDELAFAKGLVSTRVLYTGEEIFFLLDWEDPTRSVAKEAWQFDGTRWGHLRGDEDRIALLFEITRINQFSSRGCAVICHSPPDLPREQWKLATNNPSEKGDLWHWKAARSAPYRHADDGWLTVAGNPSGSYRETGRRYDEGRGGDIRNETPDRTRPAYMPNPVRKPAEPGFLIMEEAVPFREDYRFAAGDRIPYRIPMQPDGSRFDVKAESRHAGGRWTVMLHRRLDTGHDNDVVFTPGRRFSFAVAVFDDSGSNHSKTTRSLALVMER